MIIVKVVKILRVHKLFIGRKNIMKIAQAYAEQGEISDDIESIAHHRYSQSGILSCEKKPIFQRLESGNRNKENCRYNTYYNNPELPF